MGLRKVEFGPRKGPKGTPIGDVAVKSPPCGIQSLEKELDNHAGR